MNFLTAIPLTLLISTATAASSSDAISSISALVSYDNAVASSLGAAIKTNPAYTPYSSIWLAYSSYLASETSLLQTASAELAAEPTLSAVISGYLSQIGPEYSAIITHSFLLPTDSAGAGSFMTSIATLLDALQGGVVPQTTGTGVFGSSTAIATATASTSAATPTRNAAPLPVLNPQLGIMSGAVLGVLVLAAWL